MVQLKRIPVDSSMISAVGYDDAAQILYAEFNSGKVWAYEEVPKEEFDDLLQASSVGSFMRSNIIGCYGDYPVRRGRDFKW